MITSSGDQISTSSHSVPLHRYVSESGVEGAGCPSSLVARRHGRSVSDRRGLEFGARHRRALPGSLHRRVGTGRRRKPIDSDARRFDQYSRELIARSSPTCPRLDVHGSTVAGRMLDAFRDALEVSRAGRPLSDGVSVASSSRRLAVGRRSHHHRVARRRKRQFIQT